MKRSLTQLWGIIWYELKLQWARRSLLIVGVCLMLLGPLLVLLAGEQPDLQQQMLTFILLLTVSPPFLLLLLLSLPPVVAEAVARDQQLGVAELRDTLPISTAVYLAGKVVAVALFVLGIIGAAMLALWLAAVLRLGMLNTAVYLRVWLQNIAPPVLLVTAVTVLLASRQPTRKRATLVGMLMSIYGALALPLGMMQDDNWLSALLPTAWLPLLLDTVYKFDGQTPSLPPWFWAVALLGMVMQLGLVWTAVWAWWRYRQTLSEVI